MQKKSQNGAKPGPARAVPGGGTPDARFQRTQDLLSGRAQPPNQFASYIVECLKGDLARGQQAQLELKSVLARKAELEDELLRLEGRANKYLEDLREWDRELATPAAAADDASQEVRDALTEDAPEVPAP